VQPALQQLPLQPQFEPVAGSRPSSVEKAQMREERTSSLVSAPQPSAESFAVHAAEQRAQPCAAYEPGSLCGSRRSGTQTRRRQPSRRRKQLPD